MCSYFCAHCNSMFVSGSSWAGKPGLCPVCGGVGCFNSRQHKPPTTAEIEELKQLCANYANPCCGVVEADVWKAFNAIPRILLMLAQAQHEATVLSRVIDVMGYEGHIDGIPERLAALLTPPTDAAVREAVDMCPCVADDLEADGQKNAASWVRTLIRAVQAPRPDASCAAECLECDTRGGPWNAKPTDAAVREAVERLVRRCDLDERDGWSTFAVNIKDIRTLLCAVQPPRLTEGQKSVLSFVSRLIMSQDCRCGLTSTCSRCNAFKGLRAAFPEAFTGEVGRGE